MGGDMYWSTGVSVISNIPYKPHWPAKIHGFVNAGSLAEGAYQLLDAFQMCSLSASETGWNLQKSIKNALLSPSLSVGLGLIYQFDPIRVEVNFGMPVMMFHGDGGRRGIQVGIGLDFL
jgi:outer membrane protein insertion porin family